MGTSYYSVTSGIDLPPQTRLVIFGGGTPNAIPGIVEVSDSGLAGGLPPDGGSVLLLDQTGTVIDSVSYGKNGSGASFVFESGQVRLHHDITGRDLFSPGTAGARLRSYSVVVSAREAAVGDTIRFNTYGIFDDASELEITEDVDLSYPPEVFSKSDTGDLIAVLPGHHAVSLLVRDMPPSIFTIATTSAESSQLDAIADQPQQGNTVSEVHSDTVTVLTGVPFHLELMTDAFVSPAAGRNWLTAEGQTIAGTADIDAVGDWFLEIQDSRNQVDTITVRVITPNDILVWAPSEGREGLTCSWPLPSSFGLNVQAGDLGQYDPTREAIIWRPSQEDIGEKIVEVAINGPGWPQQSLPKSLRSRHARICPYRGSWRRQTRNEIGLLIRQPKRFGNQA